VTSNEQVYRDALVAIRDRLQLRRKSHEDTQRDNDYAYQNANEALFATGAGFARVSDETSERRDYAAVRDAHDKTVQELARYKQALTRANGFLIMHNLEPVKLEYSSEETTAPPRVPPRSFDIEGHMELYPSDEVSAPEKACDHYWHTDGYCVKCEMPQQKASERLAEECDNCGHPLSDHNDDLVCPDAAIPDIYKFKPVNGS
jgi:hypothetical protein